MLCLGIESTAHTLGVGIVDDSGKVLANEKHTFTTEKGGIHPRKAVEHHILFYEFILKRALESAKITLKDLDVVSFSKGPGLGGCLRVGAAAARAISSICNIPILGVNHCIAHVEIGKLTSGFKDPVTLYTSGANTQILAFSSRRYRVFGETLDVGVGNFLDTFGRTIGLGFPGGPKIEELAKKSKKYIELPYSIKGMDFAFSGIQTKLDNLFKTGKYSQEELCYSTQETVFAMLTEATERAVAHIDKKEVLLTGGVAANKRLASMLEQMCKDRGIKFAVVPFPLACDNGAMIAWQGMIEFKSGKKDTLENTKFDQKWRTDDVKITYL